MTAIKASVSKNKVSAKTGSARQDIEKQVMKKYGLKSNMAVPKVIKVTVNMGLGQNANDKKELENALQEMALITGQKPVVTKVRKSEANFKIRQGWPIGIKVTLRKERMDDFINYLLTMTMPAVREFRGIKKQSLDQQGNLSLGIPDQSVFRSIPFEMILSIHGLDITVTTSGRNREMSYDVLKLMGFPFIEKEEGGSNGN
ncbi:50S ribosomal protein L5 [Candidatus Comchoanobacter bicostacola]|uniref:Large ribosomal subunit protein uL5 n=1 Tax=Candidatus Comchoanobacter bicostacola TaxID=2919598 RepID=A0ABY5DHX6_9GAMM|nr:50S ribosomal protein L5 [Candidatus Comchoanobacter bicostacola]UTC24286.1 50S ribosomal protein L5 [Candidatus Comchoanobacter bicostacola]